MRFFDRLLVRQSGKVIGIILFFLILSSGTSTPQPKDTIAPNDDETYYNRGVAYDSKGEYDRAIADYSKAIELNPKYAEAYYNRGVDYYDKKEYDRAWEDVYKAQGLGFKVHPEFLNALRKASGRQR